MNKSVRRASSSHMIMEKPAGRVRLPARCCDTKTQTGRTVLIDGLVVVVSEVHLRRHIFETAGVAAFGVGVVSVKSALG